MTPPKTPDDSDTRRNTEAALFEEQAMVQDPPPGTDSDNPHHHSIPGGFEIDSTALGADGSPAGLQEPMVANPGSQEPVIVNPDMQAQTSFNSISLYAVVSESLDRWMNGFFEQLTPYIARQTQAAVATTLDQHIPTIVENIIAKSPTHPPFPRRSTSSRPKEYDGDDDEPITPSRRRGPKLTMINQFHEQLREHLKAESVLVPDAPCADPEDVRKFVDNNEGGPIVGKTVLIDWPSGAKSPWNKEAFYVLASTFKHRGDKTVLEVAKLCSRKLERSFKQYEDSKKKDALSMAETKLLQDRKQRRGNRRRNTFERRRKIVERYFEENPKFWLQVEDTLQRIGEDGMSSDETDEEESSSLKVIRRVRLPWVAMEVSLLWKRVESYNTSKQATIVSRGNKAHLRRYESARNSQRSAVAELPKNFYDDLWWHQLHPSDRAYLQAKEDINVPDAEQLFT